MTVKPQVYDDIAAAFDWYERVQNGLGERLIDDFEQLLVKIQSTPLIYREVYEGCHRARMDVYPYYVHFLIDDQEITIVSVDHTSRNPREWRRRIRARK